MDTAGNLFVSDRLKQIIKCKVPALLILAGTCI